LNAPDSKCVFDHLQGVAINRKNLQNPSKINIFVTFDVALRCSEFQTQLTPQLTPNRFGYKLAQLA
jgi:hypothetical protein